MNMNDTFALESDIGVTGGESCCTAHDMAHDVAACLCDTSLGSRNLFSLQVLRLFLPICSLILLAEDPLVDAFGVPSDLRLNFLYPKSRTLSPKFNILTLTPKP